MIIIRKANKSDLPGIRALMDTHDTMSIDADYINNRDISLVAYAEEGTLIGFIWFGIMCNGKLAYIDKLSVHPEYQHQKVGNQLCMASLEELKKRKVTNIIGFVKQDEYHAPALVNAMRMAFYSDNVTYTGIQASVARITKELTGAKAMEITNGCS